MNPHGNTVQRARAAKRWQRVRAVSARGGTKADACADVGLEPSGLNAMLYRHTGSTRWPLGPGSTDL